MSELLAACRALVGIVEGQPIRWVGDGVRLKDTPEWVSLYNATKNAALAPSRQAGGEAVAWQVRHHGDKGFVSQWNDYPIDQPRTEVVGRFRCEYRPLYTHPAPSAESAFVLDRTSIESLVAGPFNYHHKMNELQEREAKGFDRCREMTLANIEIFFATRDAMLAAAPSPTPGVTEAPDVVSMAREFVKAARVVQTIAGFGFDSTDKEIADEAIRIARLWRADDSHDKPLRLARRIAKADPTPPVEAKEAVDWKARAEYAEPWANAIYNYVCAADNQDVPAEEYAAKIVEALARAGYAVVPCALPHVVLGEAAIAGVFETGNPKHGWDYLIGRVRAYFPSLATPSDEPGSGEAYSDAAIGRAMGEHLRALKAGKLPSEAWRIALAAANKGEKT